MFYIVNSGAGVICRCAAALRYNPRARARLHNRRGPGVLQEYRDISNCWVARALARMPPAGCSADAVCDGGRHADYRYCAAGGDVGSPLPQLGDLITLLYLFATRVSSLPFPVWIPVARLPLSREP